MKPVSTLFSSMTICVLSLGSNKENSAALKFGAPGDGSICIHILEPSGNCP